MKSLTLARYHFLSLWNWRSSYLGRFLEPIAYLVFLTAGLSAGRLEGSSSFLEYAMPGIICFVAFRSATSTVSDVANDRKWGVLAMYTMHGGSVRGYLASILLFTSAVFVGQVALLFAIGTALFGFSQLGGLTLVPMSCLALVIVIGWASIGAAVGARVDSYAVRDLVVTVTALPVVLSAPLFYSLDFAPEYLRIIASANPLTYQVAWLRSVTESPLTASFWAAAWAVAAATTALIALRFSERLSRER